MDKRELTCIGCPLGCQLTVTINGDDITVEGNTCKRGAIYAKKEVTAPTRIVTSSVQILGGEIPRVSVKTAGDIPKEKSFAKLDIEMLYPTKLTTIPIHKKTLDNFFISYNPPRF